MPSPEQTTTRSPTIVIPARLASERFPRKVLADETGRPLVQHVVDRVLDLGRVVVAADDEAVVEALEPFGTTVLLTSPACRTGTERVAEAAEKLDLPDDVVVVNVQGDEPEIDPDVVARLASRMAGHDEPVMGTVVVPFPPDADPANPALVKVVVGQGDVGCLWFSRSPIPFARSATPAYRLHVGVYAYRVGFLRQIAATPPTPAELSESLEQLRALETGHRIVGVEAAGHAGGIDTPEQYAAFVKKLRASTTSC
ncbi:MAG: 3-deoxy-manno-octulosonate cytidylyltransferase [Planctomycetota bacterium]